MRKISFLAVWFVCTLPFFNEANAQSKEIRNTQLYKLYQMKYVFGMKYNDGEVAKDALYSMIAMDPNDDSLKMVLCYYYFDQNQYASSLFVSRDLLSRNQDNIDALKINAMSLENMGVRDRAVDAYESLYLKSNDIGMLYQATLLQFELERYTECATNLDIILKAPEAKEIKLNFQSDNKGTQQVSLEAAAYNMKGMLQSQQGNKEEARKNLQKALEIEPEFSIASENLADLDK